MFEIGRNHILVTSGEGAHGEVFGNRQARKYTAPLRHQSDPFADQPMGGQLVDFLPLVADAATGRIEHARQGLQRARLASTVGANQRHHLARIDMEGDAAHRLNAPIGDTQAFNDQQGFVAHQAATPI